jgi:hypothetical protein
LETIRLMNIVSEYKGRVIENPKNCDPLTISCSAIKAMPQKKKGAFLDNLKTKLVMKFLQSWLARILESFKAKNTIAWTFIFAIATILQFGVGEEALLSVEWFLAFFDIEVSETVIDAILWVLMAITGAKTTADLPLNQRQKKIEASRLAILKKNGEDLRSF